MRHDLILVLILLQRLMIEAFSIYDIDIAGLTAYMESDVREA